MGDFLKAVACGVLRGARTGFTGRSHSAHYTWCPTRRLVLHDLDDVIRELGIDLDG